MHIYDPVSKKLINFKSFSQLLEYFEELTQEEQSILWFWNFGMKSWLPLYQVFGAESLSGSNYKLPAFPQPKKPDTSQEVRTFKIAEISEQVPQPTEPLKSDQVEESSPKPKQQRRFKRFEVRLKVIISNKKKTFLSYSKNISEGGILLEDRIPKYMFNEDSEIFISSPQKKEIITFRCSPVDDEENPNRLRFAESQAEYLHKLRSWLE